MKTPRYIGRARPRWPRLGFALVEVIIGSVIVATFVAGAIYISGQIGDARIDSQAQRNRNTFANLQSEMTAEGVDGRTSAAVWDRTQFAGMGEGGKFDSGGLVTRLATRDRKIGLGVYVRPLQIDLGNVEATAGLRANRYTAGFQLQDHETATGGSVNFEPEDATPIYEPEIGLATWNASAGTYSFILESSNILNLDAWTHINWSNPRIYLLARSVARPLVRLSYEFAGSGEVELTPTGMPGGIPGGWELGAEIPINAFETTDVLTLGMESTTTKKDGTNETVNFNTTVSVVKVGLSVRFDRIDAFGNPSSDETVTINDVAPGVLGLTGALRAALNPRLLRVRVNGPGMEDLPAGIASSLTVVNRIAGQSAGTIRGTDSGVYDGTTLDARFDADGTRFSGSGQHAWGAQIISVNPLVNDVERYPQWLRPVSRPLPHVTITPNNGSLPFVFDQTISVTLDTDTRLDMPGLPEDNFYRIRYMLDGSDFRLDARDYLGPIRLGGNVAYSQVVTLVADTVHSFSGFESFLESGGAVTALYQKSPDESGFDFMWNYGPEATKHPKFPWFPHGDNPGRMIWSEATSWLPENVPGDYPPVQADPDGARVLFGSVIPEELDPDYGHVTVDNTYTVGDVLFSNSDKSFILTNGSRGVLNFKPIAGDWSYLTTNLGDDHQVRAPITTEGNLFVGVLREDAQLTLRSINRKDDRTFYGVSKVNSGTLELDSGGVSNASSIRFTLQSGELCLANSQPIAQAQDPGGFAPIWLEGGILNLAGNDQSMAGIMRVTRSSRIEFGVPEGANYNTANLSLGTYTVASRTYPGYLEIQRGYLDIYNYREEQHTPFQAGDHFYSYYPGLATLSHVRFRGVSPDGAILFGRWKPQNDGDTNALINGEIVPRRPTTSTGIAYLTVSRTSTIYFENVNGSNPRLATQDIDVFPGARLNLCNWDNNDVLTVEMQPGQENLFQIYKPEVLSRIRFYSGNSPSGGTVNGDRGARLVTHTVTRDGETITIHRLLPVP